MKEEYLSAKFESTRRDFLKSFGAAAVVVTFTGCMSKSVQTQNEDNRPNILFFFPDQHRFDWLGGNPDLPVRTPNLDRLAERGMRFTNALCPSPLCAPSRACIASGKEYDRCQVPSNKQNYPVEQTSFYRLLRDSGYHVMACGKFDLRKPESSWGRDGRQRINGKDYLDLWGFSDGIDNGGKHDGVNSYGKGQVGPYMAFLEEKELAHVHVDDFNRRHNYKSTEPTALPDDAYADNWIARNGLELLSKAPKNKPWFLQVNFNGPHEPMDITKRMKDRWRQVEFPSPNASRDSTSKKHNEIRQNYSAMIENIDRWLGLYIQELKRRGEYKNTLIVYSSDHGEMLGDHNRWAKSVPYQPSVSVPLVVGGPGTVRAKVYDGPATTMDIAATFLDYANVSRPKEMDSRSMKALLEGRASEHRKAAYSGLGQWRLVFDGRYKLIKGFSTQPEKNRAKADSDKTKQLLLFDLHQDPLENNNIAGKNPDIVKRLAGMLENA